MTWLDTFMEKARTPLIGSAEWFNCIPASERDAARKLVGESVPVGVIQISGIWKVVFDNTEFAAGAFSELQAAVDFAAEWNKTTVSSQNN